MENDIADNMSYIVNPVNPTFAICTIRVAINMFLASFTFSFFSSSLYSGFHRNMDITNMNEISKYCSAPSMPNPRAFPIKPVNTIPSIGIEFPRHAAIMLILNGETCPPIPTIDIIIDTMYSGMFWSVKTFENRLTLVCFFSALWF